MDAAQSSHPDTPKMAFGRGADHVLPRHAREKGAPQQSYHDTTIIRTRLQGPHTTETQRRHAHDEDFVGTLTRRCGPIRRANYPP